MKDFMSRNQFSALERQYETSYDRAYNLQLQEEEHREVMMNLPCKIYGQLGAMMTHCHKCKNPNCN